MLTEGTKTLESQKGCGSILFVLMELFFLVLGQPNHN